MSCWSSVSPQIRRSSTTTSTPQRFGTWLLEIHLGLMRFRMDGVLKTLSFALSWSSLICQNPELVSKTEKTLAGVGWCLPPHIFHTEAVVCGLVGSAFCLAVETVVCFCSLAPSVEYLEINASCVALAIWVIPHHVPLYALKPHFLHADPIFLSNVIDCTLTPLYTTIL